MPIGVEDAKAFALERHGDQQYGTQSVRFHLEQVVEEVIEAGFGSTMQQAAWLHDTLEDTNTTYEELRERFGPDVAILVEAVTGRGENRRARKDDIVRKLVAYPQAIPLKMSDRYRNMQQCLLDGNHSLLKMYVQEWEDYRTVFCFGPPELFAKLEALVAQAV